MLKIEDNGNIYILVNFALGDLENVDLLQSTFPTLIFNRITSYIYTVQVPEGQEAELEELYQYIGFIIDPVPYGLNAIEALDVSNISVFHNYPYGELRGTGTLIGFIDTGIDYTNTLFQNADGTTRIVSIWDQTISSDSPKNYGYGSEYSQEDINRALQAENPYSVVPSRDEIGHGTFLAGIAAGNDQTNPQGYVGGAPDAGIIMVKLREASERVRNEYLIEEDVPAYQSNDILTGISYLLRIAFERTQPIVICIGLGTNFGAHNGSDIVEIF